MNSTLDCLIKHIVLVGSHEYDSLESLKLLEKRDHKMISLNMFRGAFRQKDIFINGVIHSQRTRNPKLSFSVS